MNNCPRCGAENRSDAGICRLCSAVLDPSESESAGGLQNSSGYTPPPKMRAPVQSQAKRRAWSFDIFGFFYSLVVIAVVFGGGGWLVYHNLYMPYGPTKVTREFALAVSKADVQSIRPTLSVSSRKYLDSQSGRNYVFNFFHTMNTPFEEGREYEIKFASSTGKYAKVLVRPGPAPADTFNSESLPKVFQDGLPITCIKENGAWKVDLPSTIKRRYATGF